MPKYNDFIQSLEKPEKSICIYALLDPDTDMMFYIGQTIQGFKRITEHYHKCDKINKSSGMYSASKKKISSLKKEGKIFKVIYLEYFDDASTIDQMEEFYITYFRSIGCNLLNHENGGTRNRTHQCTENRLNISKRTKEAMNTPEIKEKCRQHAYKTVAGYNKGKKFSQEFKDKISKAQEKNIFYIQDDLGNIYRGTIECAKALGVQPPCIWKALHGYCKTAKGRVLKRIEKPQ